MAERRVRNESPLEFFKEHVEAACERQGVDALPLTSYYVVNLLAGFVRPDTPTARSLTDEPLALAFARALQAGGSAQRLQLKQVGDVSLFISGFFSDSLRRSLVDVDYYVTLGERAYGTLARVGDDTLADVFDELAQKFLVFVDVLSEVSDRTSLTSSADLLRLYEKWLRTGSRRNGDLLIEQGIVPNASISRRIQ